MTKYDYKDPLQKNQHIIKLIRIQYGKYKISNQKPGEIVEVKI